MSEPKQDTFTPLRQRKVLDALGDGVRTWDELRALTKISDDRLGFTLGELLDLRKIWTAVRSGVRMYGIERRTGLVPRFANVQRRASDSPTG